MRSLTSRTCARWGETACPCIMDSWAHQSPRFHDMGFIVCFHYTRILCMHVPVTPRCALSRLQQPASTTKLQYPMLYLTLGPRPRLNMNMAGTRQCHIAPGKASQWQTRQAERSVGTFAGGVLFEALPFSVLYELRRHVDLSEASQTYLGSTRTLYGRCRIGEKG